MRRCQFERSSQCKLSKLPEQTVHDTQPGKYWGKAMKASVCDERLYWGLPGVDLHPEVTGDGLAGVVGPDQRQFLSQYRAARRGVGAGRQDQFGAGAVYAVARAERVACRTHAHRAVHHGQQGGVAAGLGGGVHLLPLEGQGRRHCAQAERHGHPDGLAGMNGNRAARQGESRHRRGVGREAERRGVAVLLAARRQADQGQA